MLLSRAHHTLVELTKVDELGNELGFIDITDEYELVAWEVE